MIHWRANATKYIIILTDENSDQPIIPANRFPGENTREPPTGTAWTYTSGGWAQELNATVLAIKNSNANINLFVNANVGPSTKQYGAPSCDVSGPNFKNFSRSGTLTCLKNGGFGLSLEGQILNLGTSIVARTFDVLAISNSGFIDAFFQYTVSVASQQDTCTKRKRDVAVDESNIESHIEKRQTSNATNCVIYGCDPQSGCTQVLTCNPGCFQCKIGQICYEYLEQRPSNHCQQCLPDRSKTAWSGCDDNNPCTVDSCLSPTQGCYNSYDICTQACNRCMINGVCYYANEPNPNNACEICDPPASFDTWSPDTVACPPTGGGTNGATGVSATGATGATGSASVGPTGSVTSNTVVVTAGSSSGSVTPTGSTTDAAQFSTAASAGFSTVVLLLHLTISFIMG